MFIQLIAIIIVIAAFALVYWGVKQMALPPTVQIVITVIAGLIGLALIYNWVVGGGMNLSLPR
jgi:hypothetical protein